MAGKHTDERIALTLNRLGFLTGNGNSWNESRVYSARHYHQLPAFDSNYSNRLLTLQQAAEYLAVSATKIRRLIRQKKLPAEQVVPCAPWQIQLEALESEGVKRAIKNIKDGVRRRQTLITEDQQVIFSVS
jgi:excisionase family DNA binding protein